MTNFYVVDTHSLIWYLAVSKELGSKAKEIFEKAHNGKAKIIVPIIVLIEIIFIVEKKKIDLNIKTQNKDKFLSKEIKIRF